MLERDHTARLPLETKLEILKYLPRRDLLKSTALSRVWHAVAWLDPRLFISVCACESTVKAKRRPHSKSKDLAVCSLNEALEYQLPIAVEFDPSEISRQFCCCTKVDGQRPFGTDWARFSRLIQPLARLVRSLRVVASDSPHECYFDHTLPTLHSLTLESIPPSQSFDITQPLSQWLTADAAPALRSLDLYAFHFAAPGRPVVSITKLLLAYSWCRLPKGADAPMLMASMFPQLRHLTLNGHPCSETERKLLF